VQNAWPIIKSN